VGIGYASPSNLLSVQGTITSGNPTAASIGGTPADDNTAEMGPGYINLARDDTATVKQLLFGKNGSVHSYLETSTSGLNIGGADVIINDAGANLDFRVESENNANALWVHGANDNVICGMSSDYGEVFQVKMPNDNHARSIIGGNAGNQASHFAEGVIGVDTTSLGTILTIPVTSQANLWRPTWMEIMIQTAEYNANFAQGGSAVFEWSSLTSLGDFTQISVAGNVSSVTTSSCNILVNFTNDYTNGLNGAEGLVMYYKILGITPGYVQTWNATLN